VDTKQLTAEIERDIAEAKGDRKAEIAVYVKAISKGYSADELAGAISRGELFNHLGALVVSNGDTLGFLQKSILDRVDALGQRIAEIESRGVKYWGTFQRSVTYPRGAITTHDGSAWVAIREVDGEVPGTSGAWVLMVKRGRDGKDA
jgi:hypothetical protein